MPVRYHTRQGDRWARGQLAVDQDDHTENGAKQVTYAGHPLYTYVADSDPDQTFYVDVSQFGAAGQQSTPP